MESNFYILMYATLAVAFGTRVADDLTESSAVRARALLYKKAALLGDDARSVAGRTCFVPFSAILGATRRTSIAGNKPFNFQHFVAPAHSFIQGDI